ncbi:Coenzyme F420 hydrogenase/dehydrogenase, beta subunit C-terminal domain [Corticibacterium sp. UT-5YL-CI-8]|nr:Coenzyme F420 hydrogenase/dehydrogenase, beta subunit C-terminal domain [Tianweitania sp. UT-5YL-CI-8]
MAQASTIDEVVTNGLCSGCGACESIAGRDKLRMGLSPEGFMRPRLAGHLDRETEARALAACTGRGLPPPVFGPGPVQRMFGRIPRITRGHARDPDTRFRAATGGVLTALATFLVESGRVEGVLQIGVSPKDPFRNEPRLNRTRSDILASAASRYGPAAPLKAIGALLDEALRFAVVGKPCDIAALRKMAATDPRIDRQVPYMLAMFCGGCPNIDSTHRIVRSLGEEPEDVAEFRYRGHGWPGPTYVRTHKGGEHRQSYDQTWFSGMHYELMFRCKICVDGLGEHADVVAGDCWVMEDGKPSHREAGDGWNINLGRTLRGSKLLEDASAAGYLHEEPFSVAELVAMHQDHALKKRSVFWRLVGLALTGRPRPGYPGHRVVRAGLLEASPREAWAAFSGVLVRLFGRRNRESAISAPSDYDTITANDPDKITEEDITCP